MFWLWLATVVRRARETPKSARRGAARRCALQQNVRGFQIAVNDISGMQKFRTVENLNRRLNSFFDWHCAVRFQPLFERTVGLVFADNDDLPIIFVGI